MKIFFLYWILLLYYIKVIKSNDPVYSPEIEACYIFNTTNSEIEPYCCEILTFKDINSLSQKYTNSGTEQGKSNIFYPGTNCLQSYKESLTYLQMNYLFLLNPTLAFSLLKNYGEEKNLYKKWHYINELKGANNRLNGVDLSKLDLRMTSFGYLIDEYLCDRS